MSNLNERCEQILEILTKASRHTSLKELAQKTGVSRRSIYYDICNINDWLDEHGLPELTAEHGKGILLTADEKKGIFDAMAVREYEDSHTSQPKNGA